MAISPAASCRLRKRPTAVAAINAARSLLPTGLPSNPTYRKVNPADAPIMIIALTSEALTRGQMYDAAATVLAQKLAQDGGLLDEAAEGVALAVGGESAERDDRTPPSHSREPPHGI